MGGLLGELEAGGGVSGPAKLPGEVAESQGEVEDDRVELQRDGALEGGVGERDGGLGVAVAAQDIGLEGEGEELERWGGSEAVGDVAAGEGIGVAAVAEVLAGELEEGLGAVVGAGARVVGGGADRVDDEFGREREDVGEVLVGGARRGEIEVVWIVAIVAEDEAQASIEGELQEHLCERGEPGVVVNRGGHEGDDEVMIAVGEVVEQRGAELEKPGCWIVQGIGRRSPGGLEHMRDIVGERGAVLGADEEAICWALLVEAGERVDDVEDLQVGAPDHEDTGLGAGDEAGEEGVEGIEAGAGHGGDP